MGCSVAQCRRTELVPFCEKRNKFRSTTTKQSFGDLGSQAGTQTNQQTNQTQNIVTTSENRFTQARNSIVPGSVETIRLALIDADKLVRQYASALPRLTHVSFAAIVDTDTAAAQRASELLAADLAVGSLDQLIRDHHESFDAVLIHSPRSDRVGLVHRAAHAGKHVLVDTPMAPSTEEAQSAIQACMSAGVRLMVGQPLRFMPFQKTVREGLDANKLGAPGLLRVHNWIAENDGQPEQTDEPIISSAVVREVDVACWLFSAQPNTVYAVGLPGQTGARQQDVQLHFGFPAGGMALIHCAGQPKSGSGPYHSLTMIGSKGAVYADDHHNMNLLFGGERTTALNVGQGHDHIRLQLKEFVEALRSDREPSITGEAGKRAIAVAQAAANSLASHRVAHLVSDHYELR